MKLTTGLLAVFLIAPLGAVHGQTCSVGVSYLVRDTRGKPLSEAELGALAARLPKTVGDPGETMAAGMVSPATVAVDTDGHPLPAEEQVAGRERVPALLFYAGVPCHLRIEDLTLTYQGRIMRLIFGVELDWTSPPYIGWLGIDSLPFQDGTFALDPPTPPTFNKLDSLFREQVLGIGRGVRLTLPAGQWKRVSPTPATNGPG